MTTGESRSVDSGAPRDLHVRAERSLQVTPLVLPLQALKCGSGVSGTFLLSHSPGFSDLSVPFTASAMHRILESEHLSQPKVTLMESELPNLRVLSFHKVPELQDYYRCIHGITGPENLRIKEPLGKTCNYIHSVLGL